MKIVVTLVVKPDDGSVLRRAEAAIAGAISECGAEKSGQTALSRSAVDVYFEIDRFEGLHAIIEPALDGLAVDFACQPVSNRTKALFLADMDSTIIEIECVDELARAAGCVDDVARITEAAMRGELVFEESLERRVALLEGLPLSALEVVYSERLKFSPGARTLVATLAAHAIPTVLVSGGFTYFTERVASALGFRHHRANTLDIAGGRLTGGLVPPILGADAKEQALAEFARRYGIGKGQSVCVGDGANDVAMLEAAGLAVSYHGKAPAEAVADMRLRHTDLTSVLYALGIPKSRFINDAGQGK